jgi:hypothetical protein
MVYLCYLDESGTPDHGGNTPHFVFLGLSIPIDNWHSSDLSFSKIKAAHALSPETEIHAGWLARRYVEQEKIPRFEFLNHDDRRRAVRAERTAFLRTILNPKKLREYKNFYRHTEPYIHLTQKERAFFLETVATEIGAWGHCRLFGEAIDKRSWKKGPPEIFEQAFSQVISRFQHFLVNRPKVSAQEIRLHGLLIQDNNPTEAPRLTRLMREFHKRGTMWTQIPNIAETPLFVDSALTGMVQAADVCAYATRRFFDKGETMLFDKVYGRFDRHGGKVVGLRHFTGASPCECRVCVEHGRQ